MGTSSIAIGVVGKVTYQAPPRPPVRWPHQVGVVPRPSACFQDRATAHRLDQAMAEGDSAVLAGMGGVGKTQLAAHQARTLLHSGQLDLLVWITAASRAAVVSGYAQAAVEVLGADPTTPETDAQAFLAWLEPRPATDQRHWLVVLDDLADPADLRGLWPPASPHGHTLVTTRRRDAALTGGGLHLVPVGLFTADEAVTYLSTALAAHGRPEPADQLAGLAEDLGHLPLALSQAAVYLIDAAIDCATYRTQLADRASMLTAVLPDPTVLPDDQPTTVAAAWSLSLQRADQLRPAGLASPMLQLAAMLDPNGIPGPVLESPPALAHLAQHRTAAAPGQAQADQVAAPDARGALRALYRLSLVDHTPGTLHEAVRVHQLLQRAVRDTLTPQERDLAARAAADALLDAWPDVERDTALAQALRANADALTHHAEDALYQADTAHPVLFRTGSSLGEAGQAKAAIDHYRHLVSATQHHLGPDHPHTLTARLNLASWRGKAGDAAGAAAAFEHLLTDLLRVLGPDHPHTLSTRNNLAYCRQAWDPAGAATAFEQLLTDQERVLGPDDPHTLATRNNLASCHGEAGDAAGAATAFEQLLTDQERVLGPDHPDTLATRHNLASWRWDAGDVPGAAAAFEQVLSDRERVLGPAHPDTRTTRAYLAYWRGEAGDAAGAVTAYEQVLADRERVLGPDHPDTLATRLSLAYWRWEAGDSAGAITAYEQLFSDQDRVLGPDHPDTHTTRACLASRRRAAGDTAGAVADLEQLLTRQERVLGPDHPDTHTTRHNLASWRGEAGDAAGAVTAFEQLLADRERIQGPDHPDTLTARNNLAYWRGKAGEAVARPGPSCQNHGGVELPPSATSPE
ncbi:tetratricopeptide repeat protein [Streptomyces sp. NRRL B-3648]|uniref:tetratricopeptide repeat protein n=1 Tax=Streptomyces sp. NRRL B-3648 TaxID=1519493 RepID=UPI0007C84A83|nr:tetratricopeptide repeat protein [Streptomyces sp. NRRL B-3648]